MAKTTCRAGPSARRRCAARTPSPPLSYLVASVPANTSSPRSTALAISRCVSRYGSTSIALADHSAAGRENGNRSRTARFDQKLHVDADRARRALALAPEFLHVRVARGEVKAGPCVEAAGVADVLHQFGEPFKGLVAYAVARSAFPPDMLCQIDQQRVQFVLEQPRAGGRAPGGDGPAVEHDRVQPFPRQKIRGQRAGDSAAEDRHVAGKVSPQRAVARHVWREVGPECAAGAQVHVSAILHVAHRCPHPMTYSRCSNQSARAALALQ